MINEYWSKWWLGIYFLAIVVIALSHGLLLIVGEQFRFWIAGYLWCLAVILGFGQYFFNQIEKDRRKK